MKHYFYLALLVFIVYGCGGDYTKTLIEEVESTACVTEAIGIKDEYQDPFYLSPTPNPSMEATHKWLWYNENDRLKVYSRGEVSDEVIEYSLYEFSFNKNNCLKPVVLFSNFSIELEIVLNTQTNEYEYNNNVTNIKESKYSLKVESFTKEKELKLRVYDTESKYLKDIYAKLIPENNKKIER